MEVKESVKQGSLAMWDDANEARSQAERTGMTPSPQRLVISPSSVSHPSDTPNPFT